MLEPHVERMIGEQEQLKDRTNKLQQFISYNPFFGKLSADRQGLMQDQLVHMNRYLDVLNQRIQLENKE